MALSIPVFYGAGLAVVIEKEDLGSRVVRDDMFRLITRGCRKVP